MERDLASSGHVNFPYDGSMPRLLIPLAVVTCAKWLERRFVPREYSQQQNDAEDKLTELF
jgi:hypothetical protein